tara:strand:- start:469 stop:1401 length:933 start_codon:yes stop_codon:yes gene_type:complete
MGNGKFQTNIIPDGQYDPTFQSRITPRTKLSQNSTLSKFLGSYNDPVVFNNISSEEERLLLAKQYYLHAEIIKTVNSASGSEEFSNFRLVVTEGYYRPAPAEILDKTDGINHLKTKGRAVVYELIGEDGEVDLDKTFDLAVYWKQNIQFEKMILNYDNFNPDGSLHADIILIMPRVIPPWNVTYNNKIETRYNNAVQTTGELLEIGREEETSDADLGNKPIDTSKPFAVFATGKTGFGTGLTGYFYPLYLDKEKVPKPFHIHTFEEYEDIVFYMPNSSKNHAKNTYNAELYTLYGSSGQSGGTSGGSGGY